MSPRKVMTGNGTASGKTASGKTKVETGCARASLYVAGTIGCCRGAYQPSRSVWSACGDGQGGRQGCIR